MRQHAAKSDGSADKSVEFLVAADSELQVAGSDAFDFEVFDRILLESEVSRLTMFCKWF